MARRIWLIAKKEQVEQSDIDDAKANNCSEVANGIPPVLEGTVDEAGLPMAYEEPEPIEPEPVRDLATEIDEIKARVRKLEKK